MHGCAGARGSDDGSGEGDSRDCCALPEVNPQVRTPEVGGDRCRWDGFLGVHLREVGDEDVVSRFPTHPDGCGRGGRGEGGFGYAIGTFLPIRLRIQAICGGGEALRVHSPRVNPLGKDGGLIEVAL